MKKQVRITESQIQKAIIATANRLINEGQGWEMAKAGIRNAFGGGKGPDKYPLPADRFDPKWSKYDDEIADNNMGMEYYDEEGRPTNSSTRTVPNDDYTAFEIENNERADNSWLGRMGRRAGMAVHDGAMKLGAKVRDFYDEGSGIRKEGLDRHEKALNEAIERNSKRRLNEARAYLRNYHQQCIVNQEIRKALR